METWQRFNASTEGFSSSVGSATGTNITHVFKHGTKNIIVQNVRLVIPGVDADAFVGFYNGTPTTTAITGSIAYTSQPDQGFNLNGAIVTAGSLGIRVTGNTTAGLTAYAKIDYLYNC